jgi:hypothetical protein
MADKEKKEKKSKSKKNFLSTVLKDTTLGGGVGVQETPEVTIPSVKASASKKKYTVEVSAAKPISKVNKQNINSELGLDIIRQGDKSSAALQLRKSGKNKYIGFEITKTFGGTKKRKGGKVKKAYLGSFIAGGPNNQSNKTYRKYYKGMV